MFDGVVEGPIVRRAEVLAGDDPAFVRWPEFSRMPTLRIWVLDTPVGPLLFTAAGGSEYRAGQRRSPRPRCWAVRSSSTERQICTCAFDDADMTVFDDSRPARRADLQSLYLSEVRNVYGFLLARCGDRHVAEDLTTETFINAADRFAQGRDQEVSGAWLMTTARRRLIDHWRRTASQRTRVERLGRETAIAAGVQDSGDTHDRVLTSLGSLPERQRAALSMRYMDEMSVSEVADVTGVDVPGSGITAGPRPTIVRPSLRSDTMTEPDDVAIDALRRFDQPHELDPASVRRIEERMLGRFDEVAATQPPDVHRIEETVELRSVDTAPTSRRLRSTWLGLAAAAVIVVLGAIVFLRSGAGDPEEVPSTQPSVPTADQGRVAEQLQEYCVEFVVPLTEASALWVPLGFQSEERADAARRRRAGGAGSRRPDTPGCGALRRSRPRAVGSGDGGEASGDTGAGWRRSGRAGSRLDPLGGRHSGG